MCILASTQLLESYRSIIVEILARTFGVSGVFINSELSRFIASGRIHAPIDKVHRSSIPPPPPQPHVEPVEPSTKCAILENAERSQWQTTQNKRKVRWIERVDVRGFHPFDEEVYFDGSESPAPLDPVQLPEGQLIMIRINSQMGAQRGKAVLEIQIDHGGPSACPPHLFPRYGSCIQPGSRHAKSESSSHISQALHQIVSLH
ncbi:hypothetical protein BKA70DRAFT_1433252 [Coprinopsis sp. MPI-PUGE-AT-0042]|nr:hypothetical protein BKA70DRAFT_1433252 [Coprinopsis sp. MPI-PUGE-AT-0042]